MGNKYLIELIVSSIQDFFFDVSMGACKKLIYKFKQWRFNRKLKKSIEKFCIENGNSYINSDSFLDFVKNYRPFDRILKNTNSLNDAKNTHEIINKIVEEAKYTADLNGKSLTYDDETSLKDLCNLVNHEISDYYENILDDNQKIIISKNAQHSYEILKCVKKCAEGNKRDIKSLEKLVNDKNCISTYGAIQLVNLIYKKMWEGKLEEAETISSCVSVKSEDIRIAVDILKSKMFEDNFSIEKLRELILLINAQQIKNIVIRNIIPLMYFKKENFKGVYQYTDSENQRAIMSAIDNEDFSFIFNIVEVEDNHGIKTDQYHLNKRLFEAESWLANQILMIYVYNLKLFNIADLISDLSKDSNSWLSTLLIYDKKVNRLIFEGVNENNKKEFEIIIKDLFDTKQLYSNLSCDFTTIYFSICLKIINILKTDQYNIIKIIPSKLQDRSPIKDYLISYRIEEGSISFDEVYDFCKKKNEFWILVNYMVAMRNKKKQISDIVERYPEIPDRDEAIFFMYIEELTELGQTQSAIDKLNLYRSKYDKFFEYWDIYMNLDEKTKDDFLKLCKEDKIGFVSGHAGCTLVERLISFGEFDLAEKYTNFLEMRHTNLVLLEKYRAFILYGKNKCVDALQLFKETFNKIPNDQSILNAILSISINLKRRIDYSYIKLAEKSNNCKTLVLAAGAYAINGDYSNARRCNLKAMYLSDDCENPAFNQYLGLNLQDKQEDSKQIKSVEKNTAVVLKNDLKTICYCVHGNIELPKSPYIWSKDIHLYISDAAQIGLIRKQVGDILVIDQDTYTVISIESLENYVTRKCFENIVKNGSAKAVTAPTNNGQVDIEAFISQLSELSSSSNKKTDWIKQYNDFDDVPLPLFMISKMYNFSYTQFVKIILEDPKVCVRELIHENLPSNDKFIISFTSLLILKKIGINNSFLNNHNVYVTESTVIQIASDTSQMIAYYANDTVSSMGMLNGKPYFIETDEKTKEQWLKEAGELKNYAEGIKTVAATKDWKSSIFNQIDMTQNLGIPDYDAISISINEGFTVIGTEAIISSFSYNDELKVDVVSITNWLVSLQIDVIELISVVTKMIELGCIFSVTVQLVLYISKSIQSFPEEKANTILELWDLLFEKYDSLECSCRSYALESLRNLYLTVYDQLENPITNPVIEVFLKQLLRLNKLKLDIQYNPDNGFELIINRIEQ